MQKELGDTPDSGARLYYKRQWLIKHGYDRVENSCFLCEFAGEAWWDSRGSSLLSSCDFCPVDWSSLAKWGYRCFDKYMIGGKDIYLSAPISEILALPVKGENDDK